MFENENSGTEDVSAESSPAPESPSLNESPNNDQKSLSETQSKPDNTPFHEHPRFKELVEQKNQSAKRYEDLERKYQELSSKFDRPKTEESKEAKLIARLKGIDPEFGSWAEGRESDRKELSDLKQWKAQFEQQSYVTSAKSIAERLQGELKVDKDLHEMYLSQIPMGTPLDKIADAYKHLNDRVSKLFEARERAALSKYSESKKSDSKVPANNKGQPVKSSKSADKQAYSRNPDEARAQVVANAMRQLKNQ